MSTELLAKAIDEPDGIPEGGKGLSILQFFSVSLPHIECKDHLHYLGRADKTCLEAVKLHHVNRRIPHDMYRMISCQLSKV